MHRYLLHAAFLLPLSLFAQETYSECWQEFNWTQWQTASYQLDSYMKLESGNHWRGTRSFQIAEQFGYQATPNLSLWISYRYLHNRDVVPHSKWHWQHRLELEFNPTFDMFAKSQIQTRNRLEIRHIEDEPKIRYRFRQRTLWAFPVTDMGWLTTFSFFNEIFYNFEYHQIRQDRLCPFMLTFALNDKVDFSIFFLMRFFKHDDHWRRSAVVGTELEF